MMKKHFLISALLSATQAMAEPTGLHPLTPNELKRMQRELGMKKIKVIRPTPLGLSRVNSERKRRGLETLPFSSARAWGRDTETDDDLHNDFKSGGLTSDVSTSLYGRVLPSAVDNSTLSAFPSIGQQRWNSCVGWAMGYYQATHNNALTLGWSSKTDSTKKCSPKFLYTMINSGSDNGAYFSDAFNMLNRHGCISWSNFPEDSDFRAWNTNPDHWKAALSSKMYPVEYVYNMDTQSGIEQAKQLLTNGYVLTFGTYINSWVFTTIKANPFTGSNPLVGQQALLYVNGTNGSHAMTIVGYDDSAWVDINSNNQVDAGELGVFKIANSWGTSWRNSGFAYVPFDALKTTSAVTAGPTVGRQPAFQSRLIYHQPPRAAHGVSYTPRYLVKFTLNHVMRNQLSLQFGLSSSGANSPSFQITPFALMNKGGLYAFNGTTTATPATFIMDVSDLPFVSTGDNKVYVTLSDNTAGNAATITAFEILDLLSSTQTAATIYSPQAADAGATTVSAVHNPTVANQPPLASFTTNASSGVAPLVLNLDGLASIDNDGTITSYLWQFGDGSVGSAPTTTKTYTTPGTFTVVLTVTDDYGATSSTSKAITVMSSTTPPSGGDSTPPVVALTSPKNGERFTRYTSFTATATASDNVGVTKVNFYLNGFLKCTVTTPPYSCNMKMLKSTNLPVKASAFDAAGNTSSFSVSISN
jgi:PKD repeat protein